MTYARAMEEAIPKQRLDNQPERGAGGDTPGSSRMADEQGDDLLEDIHEGTLQPFVESLHWIGTNSFTGHARKEDRNHGEWKDLPGVSAPGYDVRRTGG